jgi:type IV pilus assembly protein PilC
LEFNYIAKNESGEISKGTIQAQSEYEATANLQKQGLFISEIKAVSQNSFLKIFKITNKKVTLKEKIIFTKQLAMMVSGGMPLVEALKSLQEEAEKQEFGKIIGQVTEDVSGGSTLSKAMEKHPKIFPSLYTSVVVSGEKSGKLAEVLERLADQYQKDYDLITKVKSAISYPLVVVSALVGVMILMLIFVIPKLKKIFDEMGVPLPFFTRLLLGTSQTMVDYWYLFLIGIVGLFVLLRYYFKTKSGRLLWDKFKVKVPIFGQLVKKIYMARLCRTSGTLVSAGLPMMDILATNKEIINNVYYRPAFDKIAKDVESGVTLSAAMKEQKIFPAMIPQMLSVAEKSGKVEDVFFHLADFFDKEVEATTASLTSLIEPILILLIGSGVGIAVISVIMPIYSLTSVIN